MDMENKKLVVKADETLFNKAKEFEKKYNLFGFSGIVQNDMEINAQYLAEFITTSSQLVSAKIHALCYESNALLNEIYNHIVQDVPDVQRDKG